MNKILASLFFVLMASGAFGQNQTTAIKFVFDAPAIESFTLAATTIGSPKNICTIKTSKDTTIYFEGDFKRYMYVFSPQRQSANIYMERGQELTVHLKQEQFSFEGATADICVYLNQDLEAERNENTPYSKKWLVVQNTNYKNKLKVLDQANVPDTFKALEQQRQQLLHYYSLINSPSMNDMFGNEKYPMCDNYYAFLKGFTIDSPDVLHVSGWYNALRTIFHRMEQEGLINANVDDYLYQHCTKINQQQVKEAYVIESLEFLQRHDFRDNIDAIGQWALKQVDHESARAICNEILAHFKPLKEKYASITKGSVAANFEGTTPGGEKRQLSDFNGKVVLLDIWFLGCAPCKSEMPYMKKLEEELHSDELVFITLSLDQKNDVEKWKAYVKEHQLSGVQLNSPQGFKASVVKDYMLRGVPRYIIIDKEGRIHNAFSRRPSDPKLKKELELLLKG